MPTAPPVPRRHVTRWHAIGCTVHLETRRGADLPVARALLEDVLDDVDAVASRFRDDSDLARVNRSPGQWVVVDPLLVAAVRVAVDAAAGTDGLVHPLLGRPLVELGYDRTFGELRPIAHPAGQPAAPPPLDSWRDIELGEAAVRIPAGTALDLGATGKAWCTDLAVTALETHLDGPAIVSIGGDLRTVGDDRWEVAISEHPDAPAEQLVDVRGALATSSTRVRRWTAGALTRHHLLDPRTGAPADEVWRTVTVAAGTCVAANTAATATVVAGAAGPAALDDAGLAARLVAHDGTVRTVGDWPTPTDRSTDR